MSNNENCAEQWSAPVDARIGGTGKLTPVLAASVSVSGPWTLVRIAGEMDLQVVPLVRELKDADARQLVFDLRQVTFMDVAGLSLLLRSQREASRTGGCVRLVAPSRKVRRVLVLTGLIREFSIFPSVHAATTAPVPVPTR